MTRTNIRHAAALISQAGIDFDHHAVIPDLANFPVHIVYRNFLQEELEEYNIPIQHRYNNMWIRDNNTLKREKVSTPPHRPHIPQIIVSHAMQNFWARSCGSAPEKIPEVAKHEVAYLLVVHGQAAAMQPKLLVKWDLDAAAQAMMNEVQNGFSVAFSGAVLKSEWTNRTMAPRLIKVDDLASLRPQADENHMLRILY
jgi:hypothetical protein